jgi:hypothetical protein
MKIRWLTCMTPVLLAAQLPGQISTQSGLIATATGNVSILSPMKGHMRWTGNQLVGCDYCDGAPILWTVDKLGNRQTVALSVPGADYLRVMDLASGPDGSLAAVGMAISGDSRMGTFIAKISPDRSRQVVTRVWPYGPQAVTVAPDGTIWTIGAVMKDDYRGAKEYNTLRHYAASGQLLASTHVRGVRPNNGGMYAVSETSLLMASQDRIGWLTNACQYLEFSLEAVQIGSYDCPNGYKRNIEPSGVALSSAGDLLVGGKWGTAFAPMELDRATKSWKVVPVFPQAGGTQRLLGFDGLTLVTLSSSSMQRYTWSPQGTSGGH